MGKAAVEHVPEEKLHLSQPTWWLTSRFHFSFADWYDPARTNFGVLRVCNDDIVKAGAGFGRHPHRDAEIFSYVVEGELSHADSMGNKEALPPGSVQYLSAGTGITHSEMNDGRDSCRFLQIWLTPDQKGHSPQYGSQRFEKADRHNKLLMVLGGTSPGPDWGCAQAPSVIKLHQDSHVYVSESAPGQRLEVQLGPGRQAYLVCIEGGLEANGTALVTRDGAKIRGHAHHSCDLALVMGPRGAHFLMVEMPLSND